ncbi:MAG: bifunctional prephenate dehydrogenase/3-phosphoshikimate 1-carboxyvinyltransferase, partial [Coxiellaceae bacterium]|nr:bifunctional prephenate dehydrogenase/3-phosphoshikimate 1-carboxyvinyltransferase [Coxiellaceae bacterium]
MVDFVSKVCGPLSGTVRVPSDKSISHRALLFASIAEGESILHKVLMGEDNKATMTAMQSMGVTIESIDAETLRVQGVGLFGLQQPDDPLNLGNSRTGIRLLAGLLNAQPFESRMVGDASLMQRPMGRIVKPLRMMGARIGMSLENTPPLHILPSDGLKGIRYEMPV